MNTAQVYGVVRAAGSEIALSIDSLEQVVSNPEILPVPETGTYVKGVVRRGDQLIPLVAVCDLLRRGAADSGSSELALMVRSSNRVLALAIDSIVKVARPDAASISALELRPGDNALFPCLFRDSETGEAVAVLDPAALAAHPHVRSVTRHAAAEAENTNSSERLKLACFRCAGKVFAIEISHVLRGVNAADHSITPIGTSFIPTFWEIEGRQLPMLNLPGFLCLPLASTSARAGAASSSRALLLQADGKQIGIEIDDVLGALNVPASDVEPIAHSGIANAQVYRGILRAADGDTTEQPILVLDAHAIIGHEDIRNVAVDVRSSEETAGDLGDRQSYIVYQSGHGTVASALRDIEAVIPLSNFLSLKQADSVFQGFLEWRGQTVSVLDLGAILGTPLPDLNSSCSVLIVRRRGELHGFVVPQVESLAMAVLQEVPPMARKDCAGLDKMIQIPAAVPRNIGVLDLLNLAVS